MPQNGSGTAWCHGGAAQLILPFRRCQRDEDRSRHARRRAGGAAVLGGRAEAGPFSTLALLDRLVYHNPEPLVTLASIAGATSRIRVQTEVLLAPLRDPVLLAKQSARPRGWPAGATVSSAPPRRATWNGCSTRSAVSGRPRDGPASRGCLPRRTSRSGRSTCSTRPATPSAGTYAFLGDTRAVADGMLDSAAAVRRAIAQFAALGADEVILYCWATDVDQVDRLADLVG
ncbi:hypothetical protein GTS_19440 [Gandjariella thermophila]|uniref:Luciferase-like domain-containing protein n=1 Tax=Gandjariella thermophila TaxID=1931992 RepID=A0A4D4J1F1_9PSEU|nr:hypothetical protein GTS_19440 [Gandjariella thermophila]